MRRYSRVPSILIALLLFTGLAAAASELEFAAKLSGAQSIPVPGPGLITRAEIDVRFATDLSKLGVELKVGGGDNVVGAHFHCARAGDSGPVAFGLFSPGPLTFDGEQVAGTLTNSAFTGADCVPTIGRPVNNVAALALAMRDGLIYINVHTTDNFPGEVRGQMLEERSRRLKVARGRDRRPVTAHRLLP